MVRLALRQPYFTDVDNGVIMGAVPMAVVGHIKALHADGVRAVVNLQYEYGGPVAEYSSLHPPIEQLHIPVVDHTEPSLSELEKAVAFIAVHRERGERVCWCTARVGTGAVPLWQWLG